jgi:hypothetical protein
MELRAAPAFERKKRLARFALTHIPKQPVGSEGVVGEHLQKRGFFAFARIVQACVAGEIDWFWLRQGDVDTAVQHALTFWVAEAALSFRSGHTQESIMQ